MASAAITVLIKIARTAQENAAVARRLKQRTFLFDGKFLVLEAFFMVDLLALQPSKLRACR